MLASWCHINLTCCNSFHHESVENHKQTSVWKIWHFKFYFFIFLEASRVFELVWDSWIAKVECLNAKIQHLWFLCSYIQIIQWPLTSELVLYFDFLITFYEIFLFSSEKNFQRNELLDIRNNIFMVSAFHYKVQKTIFMCCKWQNQQIVYSFIQNVKQNFIYSVNIVSNRIVMQNYAENCSHSPVTTFSF